MTKTEISPFESSPALLIVQGSLREVSRGTVKECDSIIIIININIIFAVVIATEKIGGRYIKHASLPVKVTT